MADGGGEQGRLLRSLRQSRAAAFRSETVPYFRYVMQSGFGLAVSAALFAFVIGYANLLRDVPANFPAGVGGALLIILAAVRVPMRTYLNPADPVFLLPMESLVIRQWIRQALLVSAGAGMIRTLSAYAIFLPLYIRAPSTEAAASGRSLWLLGLAFSALGAWNAYGGWRERQTAYPSRRMMFRALRYTATAVAAVALLLGAPLPAFGISIGLLGIAALCWRLPDRDTMPWDKLIAEEGAVRRRWLRFLSWFVDVRSEDARPAARRWAAWVADRLPWDRRWAWRYLYAKTFTRGETFGTWARWTVVVGFVLAAVDDPVADWIVFAIGVAVSGLQLTELASLRLALSVETLPIGREGRSAAAASTARTAGMAGTLLLWLLAAVPQGWPLSWIGAAALAAGLLWSGRLVPRRISKPREDEEE